MAKKNQLPATSAPVLLERYEHARTALAECDRVDECKDWADKSLALAAYARQSRDTELEKTAIRIRARALRKAGEMLKLVEKGSGKNNQHTQAKVKKAGAEPFHKTRKETYTAAGMSDRQAKEAVRVANVPDEVFEEKIEAFEPLSVSKLAELGKVHVSNNSKNDEWYTPTKFIDAARLAMGSIDLDPASCEVANRQVGAPTFYTEEDDGLEREWVGNIWLNPPYSSELIGLFAEKLKGEAAAGRLKQACVLVNNATETKWFQNLVGTAAAVCFPQGRIKFLNAKGEEAKTPLQGQAIMYFGTNQKAFQAEFSKLGATITRKG